MLNWILRNIFGWSADRIAKWEYGGRKEVCHRAVSVVMILGKETSALTGKYDKREYEDERIKIQVHTEWFLSDPEYHDVTIYNQVDENRERTKVFQDRWERVFEYRSEKEWAFWRRGFWMDRLSNMNKVAQERKVSDAHIKNAPLMTEVGQENNT